jgi:hypothetical protein
MPKIIIPQGLACIYYSPGDEAAFFGWLQSIPGVIKVEGRGRRLLVTLRSRQVSDSALRELIGLHMRYRLPMRSLAQFRTPRNKAWFGDRKMFWYKKIFGRSR